MEETLRIITATDVILLMSVAALCTLIWKLYKKIKKLEKTLTKVIREDSIRHAYDGKKPQNCAMHEI